jgi:hypothetical protein
MKTFSSAERMETSVQLAVYLLWMHLNINSFSSLLLDNISLWTPTRDSSILNFYHHVKFILSDICAAEANEVCNSADFLQSFVLLKLTQSAGELISFSSLCC